MSTTTTPPHTSTHLLRTTDYFHAMTQYLHLRDAVVGSSQTNSDAVPEGCQTEHIETCSAACQFPEAGTAMESRYYAPP